MPACTADGPARGGRYSCVVPAGYLPLADAHAVGEFLLRYVELLYSTKYGRGDVHLIDASSARR